MRMLHSRSQFETALDAKAHCKLIVSANASGGESIEPAPKAAVGFVSSNHSLAATDIVRRASTWQAAESGAD